MGMETTFLAVGFGPLVRLYVVRVEVQMGFFWNFEAELFGRDRADCDGGDGDEEDEG